MNLITPHIVYDEQSFALELTLMGCVLKAKLLPSAVHANKFTLPATVAKLLRPIVAELSPRWDAVNAAEDIASIEADEEIIHEVMAQAFWWATANYNTLDEVRRSHYAELEDLAERCHAFMEAPLPIINGETVALVVES